MPSEANAPSFAAADVDLSAELVSRLVGEQHPDLLGEVSPFSVGWDNEIYSLGTRWLARMPRRKMGAENILRERACLPEVAPLVSLPVPVPVRAGGPGGGYPYPWSITKNLPGEVVGVAGLEGGSELAQFFAELHVPCGEIAPRKAARAMPLASRSADVQKRLWAAGEAGPALWALWEKALEADSHAGARCWVHGDLHPFNLLVREGALAAVLDWGDVFGGDPAPDYAAAWMLLEPEHHGLVRDGCDEARWERGVGWAVYFAVSLMEATAHGAGAGLGEVGRKTAERLLHSG